MRKNKIISIVSCVIFIIIGIIINIFFYNDIYIFIIVFSVIGAALNLSTIVSKRRKKDKTATRKQGTKGDETKEQKGTGGSC